MSDNKYNLSFDRNKSSDATAKSGGDASDDVLFGGDANARSGNAFGTNESSFSEKPKRGKGSTAVAKTKTQAKADVEELGGQPAAPLTKAASVGQGPAKKSMAELFEQGKTPAARVTKQESSVKRVGTAKPTVVEPVAAKPEVVKPAAAKPAVAKRVSRTPVAPVTETVSNAEPEAVVAPVQRPTNAMHPAFMPVVLAVAGLAAGVAIYQGTGRVPVAAAAAGLGVIGAVLSFLTPRK